MANDHWHVGTAWRDYDGDDGYSHVEIECVVVGPAPYAGLIARNREHCEDVCAALNSVHGRVVPDESEDDGDAEPSHDAKVISDALGDAGVSAKASGDTITMTFPSVANLCDARAKREDWMEVETEPGHLSLTELSEIPVTFGSLTVDNIVPSGVDLTDGASELLARMAATEELKAVRAGAPWPEWAIQAKAADWAPPKGWRP